MNSNTGNDKRTGGASSEFQENLDILRQIDFFSGIPLEAIKVIAYLCFRETFKTGDYLFSQDDEDGRALYVISGTVAVQSNLEGVNKSIGTLQAGEFVGRLALVGNMRRLFALKAETDVICLTLSRDKFTKVLEQFPQIMPKMINTVVGCIYKWEKQFIHGLPESCDCCLPKLGVSLV